MNSANSPPITETTTAFRLERKAIKEAFANRPEGLSKDELSTYARSKGIDGIEFERVLTSLLSGGHLFYDERKGKYHFVRNE